MNVVISSLNSKYIHSSLAPWYLFAGIREYSRFMGDNVSVIEGTINEPIEEICDRILAESPDVLGLSCYIWNITKVYELVSLVKVKRPDCIIVLGGLEVSYNPCEVFAHHPEIDYIICGEGERPFAYLCDFLVKKKCPDSHDGYSVSTEQFAEFGIATRENGNVLPYVPGDIPPSPYLPEYFDCLNGRIAYIETSRGCPFRCAFCLSGRCGGVRFFDMERAKHEIELLANSGTKTVKFVDRTFNANPKRAYEIWKFIIENENLPDGVCFHFEVAGDLLDEKCMQLLETAPCGLIQLEIGLQSFNTETLAAINRKTDLDVWCRNLKRLLGFGNIHIHIDLIAGLPKEDLESFKISFNKAYELKPHALQLGFLKLLHGADMREYPLEYPCDFSVTPPYEVLSTPSLSGKDIELLKGVEDVCDRLCNSGRFVRTLKYLDDVCFFNPKSKSESITPFDFMFAFHKFLTDRGQVGDRTSMTGVSLDEYTNLFLDFIGNFSANHPELGLDLMVIRDRLVVDRLTTNASGKLPECLKVYDERLRKAKIYLKKAYPRRAVAILYSSSQIVYVDYVSRNPVTGAYLEKYISLETLDDNI